MAYHCGRHFLYWKNVNQEKYEVIPRSNHETELGTVTGSYGKIPDDTWMRDEKSDTGCCASKSCGAWNTGTFRMGKSCTQLDLPHFRYCMERTGRMEPYRIHLNLPGFRLSAAASFASALCMDRTGRTLAGAAEYLSRRLWCCKNIRSARAVVLPEDFTYPLFVKPVRAGSSYGSQRYTGRGA